MLKSTHKQALTEGAVEAANFHYLVWDIAWFGIAWVTVTRFLSVYALEIGATPTQLAWLSAGPPIVMFFASMFSVWWRNRHANGVQAVLLPSGLFRLVFLLLALTPALPQNYQPLWLIIAIMLPAVAQGVSQIVFLSMLKETTPDRLMAPLLGRRALVVNIALCLGALGFGYWLEYIPFPWNYVSMFLVAFCAAMLSQYQLHRLTPILTLPTTNPAPAANIVRPLQSRKFQAVLVMTVLSYAAFFATFPVVPIRLVEGLGASESFMGIFSVVELSSAAVFAIFARRLLGRFGSQRVGAAALLLTAVGTLIVALAPSLSLALLAAFFIGSGWGTVEISSVNFMSENTPTEGAAYYARAWSQAVWISMFFAPFLGTALVEWGISVPAVLLLGMVLRAAAAMVLFSTARHQHVPNWVHAAAAD